MAPEGANASPARHRGGAQENPACRPRERSRDGTQRGRRGGRVPCAARMRYPMGAPGRGCRGGLAPAGSAGPAAGDWLSGRAPRSHRGGHWFDPSIAHPAQRPVAILRLAVLWIFRQQRRRICVATRSGGGVRVTLARLLLAAVAFARRPRGGRRIPNDVDDVPDHRGRCRVRAGFETRARQAVEVLGVVHDAHFVWQ
jgi:hypothetical protein